ncbi:amiloride-sensitive sodium channel subunit gamma-like isoform X1 [Mizuhopecten yessoensis]|uniref:amiloride-sensitive sodium channel subunit gamma-like isoform X1 n=1 Tax=Mizuhopecten yessoensis TaxID=6573 RepID=UPI000B45F0E6|nr:amiloride-sensitive sodium channel subunit gamma-like isoform X1 [Mizuhopecten yessoensis]
MSSNTTKSPTDGIRKRKTFAGVMTRFAGKTSMQGPSYILSARLRGAKIVWTILLVLALVAMAFHLYYLCHQYFSWPKQTSVELGFKNLQMPALTFCNVNPVRNSEIMGLSDSDPLRALVDAVDPSDLDPRLTDAYKGISSTNTQPQGKRKKRFTNSLEELNLTSSKNKPLDGVTALEREFERLYMQENRDTRIALGHSIEDMLIYCSYKGQSCFSTNFTLFNTPQYGNCYTIESTDFISKDSGPSHSLKLVLDVNYRDYLKGITQGYGLRVDIHSPGTIPDPHRNGFYISTAFETDISLEVLDINRIGYPYGTCDLGTSFQQKYKRKYTRKACQNLCQQETLLTDCGCYDMNQQEIFYIAGITDKEVCNTTAELACQHSVYQKLADKIIPCKCEQECREVHYKRGVSTRQWPTRDYATVLVQSICEDPRKVQDCQHLANITDKAELRENFIKLVVYFEELNYEKIMESPAIEVAQFASDFGGAIGLWIGLSLLSIFEIVQLLVEICDWGCYNCIERE